MTTNRLCAQCRAMKRVGPMVLQQGNREVLDSLVFSAVGNVHPQQYCILQNTAVPHGDGRLFKTANLDGHRYHGGTPPCLDGYRGLRPHTPSASSWGRGTHASLSRSWESKWYVVVSTGQESRLNILPTRPRIAVTLNQCLYITATLKQ